MKFNFAKNLLLGSAFAMGAFGLVACGDDGPTKVKELEKSDVIKITTSNPIVAGTIVKFDAIFAADYDNPAVSQDADFLIDSLQYSIVNSKGEKTSVVPTANPYNGKSDQVSLSDLDVGLLLDDPGFKECGTFALIVNVYAHLDKDKKTSSARLEFNRAPELFCKEEPASSSSNQATGIEMSTYTVEMSTDLKPGLNLATGEASASTTADIVIKPVKGSGVAITSGNGTLFSAITNDQDANYDDDYDVDAWPEDENGRAAVVTDFKFKTIAKTQIADAVEAGSPSTYIYVAQTVGGNPETGVGFYAFGITAAKETKNGDFNITLKVYKKK